MGVLQQARDLLRQLGRRDGREALRSELRAAPALLRWVLPWAVLGRTQVDANPCRWLLRARDRAPDALAIQTRDRKVSFGQLVAQTERELADLVAAGIIATNRVAIVEGDPVRLVSRLFACWALGAIACPFDPESASSWLEEQLRRLEPQGLWGSELERYRHCCPRAATVGEGVSRNPITPWVRLPGTSTGVILPTSGSEGAPKLCKLSVGRLVLGGHAFGGALLGLRRGDVLYCPLPLTHATGLMAGLLSAVVHGCTLYLPGKFHSSRFFEDLASSGATQVIYVGELLRFVVAATPQPPTVLSRLRVMVGNGLDAPTFERLNALCPGIRIVEFYGATELPAILVNFAGKPGAMGRIVARRWSRFEVVHWPENGRERVSELVRHRRAVQPRKCAPGEVGELLIRMPGRHWPVVGVFEGYADTEHERRALKEGVFEAKDRYYLSGDRVYYDQNDYLYFVERVGDVWRSRGHNVSTSWLAEEVRRCSSVEDCRIYLVALDDSVQRFAAAWIVPSARFNLADLAAQLKALPEHCRPLFIYLVDALTLGSSFKALKPEVCRGQFDPGKLGRELYLWNQGLVAYDEQQWILMRSRLVAQPPTLAPR